MANYLSKQYEQTIEQTGVWVAVGANIMSKQHEPLTIKHYEHRAKSLTESLTESLTSSLSDQLF